MAAPPGLFASFEDWIHPDCGDLVPPLNHNPLGIDARDRPPLDLVLHP